MKKTTIKKQAKKATKAVKTKTPAKKATKAKKEKPPVVNTKPRTQVFSYDRFVGIQSSTEVQGLLNDPFKEGQMGFVLNASAVDISQEALDLLKKVKKSGDCIGDIDIFAAGDEACFCWLGGTKKVIDTENPDISGSRDYDASLLDGRVNIVENIPPAEFVMACKTFLKRG